MLDRQNLMGGGIPAEADTRHLYNTSWARKPEANQPTGGTPSGPGAAGRIRESVQVREERDGNLNNEKSHGTVQRRKNGSVPEGDEAEA